MFYMVASNMNGLLGVRVRSGDTTLVRVFYIVCGIYLARKNLYCDVMIIK